MAEDPRVKRLRRVVFNGGPFPDGIHLDREDAESVIRELNAVDPLRVILAEPYKPLFDLDANFTGFEDSVCGEHRTVGSRAWCHDCHEWCYPDEGCMGCRIVKLHRLQDMIQHG